MTQFSDDTRNQIIELCKRNKVRELSLFGSRARGDARPDSDFDLLVDFRPDADIDLFDYAKMQVELEEIIGYKVDLVEKAGLKRLIKDDVLREARTIFSS